MIGISLVLILISIILVPIIKHRPGTKNGGCELPPLKFE